MEGRRSLALIVAAGGRGTRLRDVTGGRAKPLMEVAGRPLLAWGLERVMSPSVSIIAVVAHPRWLEACLAVAGRCAPGVPALGVSQEKALGTHDALHRGLLRLQREGAADPDQRSLAFLHGDNIPPSGATEAGLQALSSHDAVFFARRTSKPGSSAILVRDAKGTPVALEKGGAARPGAAVEICGGYFLYGPWVWHEVGERRRPMGLGDDEEWEVDDLNAELIASKRARVVSVPGAWIHVNTAGDLEAAEAALRRCRS